MMVKADQHVSPDAPKPPTPHLSLPEVNALCLRAARGVGWSWGMAEECGEAASWFAQHGLPWCEIILHCLQHPAATNIHPAPGRWTNTGDICGLHAGVTLAEFANLPEGPTPAGPTLGNVQDARLLLPFAARCAASLNATLNIQVADKDWAEVSATTLAITTNAPHRGLVRIYIAAPTIPATHTNAHQTAPLSTQQKATLDQIALKMTVPSSADRKSVV